MVKTPLQFDIQHAYVQKKNETKNSRTLLAQVLMDPRQEYNLGVL